ncbi:hypothetical protein [Bacillus thuringiensis]|uniref:hypothetical protein n=1 Tax=Bacillus thuringiensis TaxID=1428 RepID=UPI001EDDAA66|nr:hypothetical protein [Bacillus thuringiensis]
MAPSACKKDKVSKKGNEYEQMEENIGDAVYIVVGTKVKNDIKDPILKGKITGAPMVTHKGIVKEVYNRPVMGYRYTHALSLYLLSDIYKLLFFHRQ